MDSTFEEFGLNSQLIQAVNNLGYKQPTPIQQAAIPVFLSGHDLIGQAQTGTGKTAAFVLPILQQITAGSGAIQALILAPTRELAIQVSEAVSQLAQMTPLRVVAVYGGQSYHIQTRQLERGVDVVVGTPGRLLDLIRQKILKLEEVRFLVLDEADEMLEMGFIDDVEMILAQIKGSKQTALFSATLPAPIRKLADRYLNHPQEIMINPSRVTVAETEQRYYRVREDDKLSALLRLLEGEDIKSALVFTRTKARAQDLADELIRRGVEAQALHGDLNQTRREYVLNRFRAHSTRILIATDVAARGLDIEEITHVFNYDIPADVEDYVHRIGRTGRAGKKGIAITFLTSHDRLRFGQIEAYTHQAVPEFQFPTREDILARRDEQFLNRLTEQLGKGKISQERALISQLENTSFDLVEIAAAAIQLARAGEKELVLPEISAPTFERGSARKNRADQKKSNFQSGKKPFEKNRSEEKRTRPEKGQKEIGMVRLWMNLGNTQGLHASDVVGAIANEVGIPGRSIGAIDIHSDHTFVDVSEIHVREVLQHSKGKYFLRGRPVQLKMANE